MLTVLLAATPRNFHFKHLADLIHLEPCDVLVFNTLLCHKGAAHAAQAEQASVAAHAYCGTEMASFNNTRAWGGRVVGEVALPPAVQSV